MTQDEQTLSPAGELIETARERLRLSQNAAAREIGISGTRWRQIVKGSGSSEGSRVSVRGGAETVARMARLVGVTAEAMEDAGRPDVARKIADADPQPASAAPSWDGEIIGPDGPLREGEELRWRDAPGRRTFELTVRGLSFEAGMEPGSTPEDVIGDLRRTLAVRVAQVSGDLLRSHSGS
ncbi:helix-turn-helix transcriptional regulator [Nocardiopsis tropica]|uniref:helix-turn-helix domain-containing protein n=1 Tax=Nocardiopsis tropica TaxID=109330 RepID=UPI002E875CA6|nr:helix-turn-helix transcriptional regulator [Nocardiopsis tropica]